MQPIFALLIKAEIRISEQNTKSNTPYFHPVYHPIFALFIKADLAQIVQNAKTNKPLIPNYLQANNYVNLNTKF